MGNYIYATGVGVPINISGELALILKNKEKNEFKRMIAGALKKG